MASERLQLIIETLGGARAVDELQKIGNAGKAEFDKAATAGTRAANDIVSAQARVAAATESGQARIAAASQKLETAQLRAAQSSAAVERAQLKVGESAGGTLAAAKAAEALEGAQLKAAHAGRAVEAAQAKVAAATVTANQAIAASRTELAAVEAATSKLAGTTGIADAALSKMGLSGVSTGAALKTGVAAGATAAAAAIALLAVKGVQDFASLAEEVDGVQDVMGGTAEEASKLRYAAEALGVGVDTVAGAMFKFTLNLEKNKGALAAYGVETVRAKDGSTDVYATLIGLSDAFNRLTDPVQKNQLLMTAFGKGGRELEEILSAGGARLREFAKDAERAGLVLDDAGVKKGKEFNIAMEKASLSVKGLAIGLGGGLVGALTQATDGLSRFIDKANSATKPVGGLAGILGEVIKRAGALPFVIAGDLGAGKYAQAAKDATILGYAYDTIKGKAKDAGDKASDAASGVKGLGDAAAGSAPKVGLMAGSSEALADALDPLPRELKLVGGSAKDMATDLDKAKTAAGDLTTKLDKLLGSTASVEDATSDYEEAIDKLVETLTENGKSLDLTTEKGRENSKVVRDVVGRTRDHIQALIDNGATQDQVRTAFNNHIADFRRVLTQMGLNKSEIDSLITKYGLVPESVETAVNLVGVNKAIEDTDRVVNHLIERFGLAQEAAQISVQVFGLENAESSLAAIKSDTGLIDLSAAPRDLSAAPTPASDGESFSPGEGRARGGPVLPGFEYPIGEDGPEKLRMFRGGGGIVIPLAKPRIIGGGGGSSVPSGSASAGPQMDYQRMVDAFVTAMSRQPLRAEVVASDVARGLDDYRVSRS